MDTNPQEAKFAKREGQLVAQKSPQPKNLVEFLQTFPLVASELDLERGRGPGREIDFSDLASPPLRKFSSKH